MELGNLFDIVQAVGTVVLGANVVTATTPTKTGNRVVDLVLSVLNFVSINFGKNKNADA